MTRHHYNVHCLALRILLRITLQDENIHNFDELASDGQIHGKKYKQILISEFKL